MAGATSIIKSSTFDGVDVGGGAYSEATTGWLINGSGKAYFYDATIAGNIAIGGFDSGSFHVDNQGNLWIGPTLDDAPFKVLKEGDVTARTVTLTGTTTLSTSPSSNTKIYLGNGNYNNADTAFYVDNTSKFSLGEKLYWDGSTLTITGSLRLIDGTLAINASTAEEIADSAASNAVDAFGNEIRKVDGFIGGLTISPTQLYYGAGNFANSNTAFYVAKNAGTGQANFSLGDKLNWDGSTLNITGNVVITGGSTFNSINNAQQTANTASATANAASTTANAASTTANAASATANAAVPSSTFNKSEIIKKINNTNNSTTIDGGVITAGTVVADALVADYVYTGNLDATQIKTGNIKAGNVEIGNDVGPGTGHHGISLHGDNFDNIFLRRSDGIVFFRVGVGGNNYLAFDSQGGILDVKGRIISDSGTIGGWNIEPGQLSSGSITLNASGNRITTGSGNNAIRIDSDNGIWIGNPGFGSAPFRVNMSGQLFASSGTIGGFTINDASLTRGGSSTSTRLQVGDECVLTGSTVTAGSISGSISASTNASATSTTPIQQTASGTALRRFTSREEYKFDIEDLDSQDRNLIDKLRPRKFKWKWIENYDEPILSQYLRSQDITFGFIAEEMAEIETEGRIGSFGIYEPYQDSFKPVFWRSYDLISLLVSEVQDLRKRVADLENL